MFLIKLVLATLTFVLLIGSSRAQVNVENFGQCFSPNRERGLCIYLQQCTELYGLLHKNPLNEGEKDFLGRSQCGYYNGKVLICCPSRSIKPNAVTSPTSPVTPNISSNRPTRPLVNPIAEPSRNGGLLPNPPVCGGGLHDRIYGGNKTKIDEFPWMALLEYTKPGNRKGFHCGGSLINSRYVLTASHCVNGRGIPADWSLSSVRLGEWDTSTDRDCEFEDCAAPVKDIPIEKTITHESYNPNSKSQYNDIALLRLSREVNYSDWIKPVCLPSANHLRNANFDGVSLDVAGWGKTEKASVSNIKLKARVDGINSQECNQIYSRHSVVLQDSQICAGGEKGIDSCRGDSGGPLIGLDNTKQAYYYLVGVVSFGPTPCGLEGWPGVYTRVGSHLNWIESHISP